MKKFLDLDGLTYFWNKTKNYISGMYGVRENSETVKAGDIRYLDGKENVGKILMYTQDGVTADTEPDFPYEENFNYIFPEYRDLNYAPLGLPIPNPLPYTPDGFVPALGQESSVETYPVFKYIQLRHPEMVITEEQWQQMATENNGHVPYYSSGNGSTTFRFPCLLHYFCATSDGQKLGKYEADGLPNITGVFGMGNNYGLSNENIADISEGAFSRGKQVIYGASGGSTRGYYIDFNASRSNPIYGNSDTVRPKTAYGTWIIKAYGAIPTVEEMTAQGIVQGVTKLETDVTELKNKTADSNNVKIIYPNGGTAEQPAEITSNSRYIEENPFPGYHIDVKVQLFYNEKWADVNGMVYVENAPNHGIGITASQILPDDNIIIQTGGYALFSSELYTNVPFQNAIATEKAPCRVIVHKLGKIGGEA